MAAHKMVFQCLFDASLSTFGNMEQRPYHRNCNCALHKLKGKNSTTTCFLKNIVSFPKKQFKTTIFAVQAADKPAPLSYVKKF